MTNPYWLWAVELGLSAFELNLKCLGKSSFFAGPCWCFDRFGMAEVHLEDGRRLCIGGEHEDSYDPDFYIYNDVIIFEEGEAVKILGYPESEFPPTDFHTATLVGDVIYLVGNLGYDEKRKFGQTQVLRLHLSDFSIEPVVTSGAGPGWIHRHEAEYVESRQAIRITGGKVCGDRIIDNFETFDIDLTTLQWTRTSDRQYSQWSIERVDGEMIGLFEKRMAADTQGMNLPKMDGWECSPEEKLLIDQLYCSDDGTKPVEDEDDHGVYSMVLNGIPIRIKEDLYSIDILVDGDAEPALVEKLLSDNTRLLSEILGSQCQYRRAQPHFANE